MMHDRGTRFYGLLVGILFCSGNIVVPGPSWTADVPFRVMVTELVQLDDGVDPLGKLGDYYAKVTINGVAQDNNPSCGDDPSPFGGILVPFQLFKNLRRIPDCVRATPWVFNQVVDSTQPVTVKIQIFDDDSGLGFGDDEADAFPGAGNSVDLTVDPDTGRWSGDFEWPENCSREAPFDLGGDNVRICWQISYDSDGDGLLDVWERDGVDADNDGVIDLSLAALGADPSHKDLFVELDWMAGHEPIRAEIQEWKEAFARAPIDAGGTANPDGLPGISLWVDTGALLDIAGELVGDNLGGGNAVPVTDVSGLTESFYQTKSGNFDPLRALVFRYALSSAQPVNNAGTSSGANTATTLNDTTQSWFTDEWRNRAVTITAGPGEGQQRFIKSNTATRLVLAEAWDNGSIPDETSEYRIALVGGQAERGGNDLVDFNHNASTLMHELGHTMNLGHGGGVGFGPISGQTAVNCKPNYVSIMNYSHDRIFRGDGSSIIDFSPPLLVLGGRGTAPLPDLDENNLDEAIVLDAFDPDNMFVYSELGRCSGGDDDGAVCSLDEDCQSTMCSTPTRLALLNEPVDWNGDGDTLASGLVVNINTAPFNGLAEGCKNSVLQLLQGHDDWANISLSFAQFGDSEGGPLNVAEGPEPTLEERRRINEALNTADLAIEKDAIDTVEVGDPVTFDLTVINQGPNPAFAIELIDTLPGTVSYVSDSAGCSEGPAGTLTCGLGVLLPGEESLFEISVSTGSEVCDQGIPQPFTNLATVSNEAEFAGPDNPADNEAQKTVLPVDTTPPVIENATVNPATLWPPNHRMIRVSVAVSANDLCDTAPVCRITGVSSNEPVDGPGDGNTAPDWQIVSDLAADLRAERSGRRTGRVYTLDIACEDASGNAATASVAVEVAHNQ